MGGVKTGALECVVIEGTVYITESMLNEWLKKNIQPNRRRFNEKMRKATAIIPEWMYDRIAQMARAEGTSVAKIICDLLGECMKEDQNNG